MIWSARSMAAVLLMVSGYVSLQLSLLVTGSFMAAQIQILFATALFFVGVLTVSVFAIGKLIGHAPRLSVLLPLFCGLAAGLLLCSLYGITTPFEAFVLLELALFLIGLTGLGFWKHSARITERF